MSQAFKDLEATIGTSQFPPLDQWQPTKIGEIDIRIREDGTWFHEGREIVRTKISKLFSTVLVRENKEYFLKTPAEKLKITVDDAPFVVVEYESQGQHQTQQVVVRTNFDECVPIDREHPIFLVSKKQQMKPYVHIRSGLNALVLRSVFYRMAEEVFEEQGEDMFVWSNGIKFPLPTG